MSRNQGNGGEGRRENQNEAKVRKERTQFMDMMNRLASSTVALEDRTQAIRADLEGAKSEQEKEAIRRSFEFMDEHSEELLNQPNTERMEALAMKYGNDDEKLAFERYKQLSTEATREGDLMVEAYRAQITPEDLKKIETAGALITEYRAMEEELQKAEETLRDNPFVYSAEALQDLRDKADILLREAPGIRNRVDGILGTKIVAYMDNHPWGGDDDEHLTPLSNLFRLPYAPDASRMEQTNKWYKRMKGSVEAAQNSYPEF